jgi:hypothetical protein
MLYYDEQNNTVTTRPHRQGIHFPCKPSRESFPPNPSKELLARHGFSSQGRETGIRPRNGTSCAGWVGQGRESVWDVVYPAIRDPTVARK